MMTPDAQVPNGPRWPVDPRFVPLAGFDADGQPQSLTIGPNGLKVESLPSGGLELAIGAPADSPATTDAGEHSLIALLKRLLGKYQNGSQPISQSLPVVIAYDQVVAAGGVTSLCRAGWVRPANTTAYSVDDVVGSDPGAVCPLPDLARAEGGSGVILSLRLTATSTAAAGQLFDVWLFNQPPVAVSDNAPFPLLFADEPAQIGKVSVSLATGGAGSDCATGEVTGINLPYQTAPGSRDLYAVVVAKTAWTPGSATAFALGVGAAND